MQVRSSEVINFLLDDMRFPRSVRHCLTEIESCFKLMPKSQQLQKLVAQLRLKIENRQTVDVSTDALHNYLSGIQSELAEIHVALTHCYFHTSHDGSQPSQSSQRATS